MFMSIFKRILFYLLALAILFIAIISESWGGIVFTLLVTIGISFLIWPISTDNSSISSQTEVDHRQIDDQGRWFTHPEFGKDDNQEQ